MFCGKPSLNINFTICCLLICHPTLILTLNFKSMNLFKKNSRNSINRIFIVLLVLIASSFSVYAQSYNYDKATEAFKQKDYDVALDYYGREINDNPKNTDAYFYRALVYKYQDNNAFALSDINTAIKNYSKKDKINLASCHSVKAQIYLNIEDNEKALSEYDIAIKLTPNYKPYYISRAQIYFNEEKYESAEADYYEIIKLDEGDVQALTCLGRNYTATKRYTDAEKILSQVIKLDPAYPSGYYFRAILFKEQKKYNQAISDIFYSYSLDESDHDSRYLFIEYAKKNLPLAFAKVNAKINEFPEKEDWYFVRAQLYENNKEFSNAIIDYNKMLQLSDASYRSTILNYRADCYKNEGMYEQAIDDFNEAISLDSTYVYYYSGRGDVKRLQGDYKGAVEDFSIAIKMKPEDAWYYYRRGWLKDEFLKDYEAGLKDYNQAISIDENYAYTYLHRGRLYAEKLKNPIKAKEDFTMILNIDTSILSSGNARQYALFHLNRSEDAILWQNKILEKYPNENNYYDAACLYSLMNKSVESISNLKLSFENGNRDFIHLSKDDDLDNVRKNTGFINLVSEWKKKYELMKSENPIDTSSKVSASKEKSQTTTIPMKSKGSGTYEVTCKVNDLKLNFIFDTGASDISISQTEALFMLKNDYLTDSDIKGSAHYMDANGDITIGTKIMFKKVEIGGLVLRNVTASVVNNKNAPLLFGQSALSKYGKIIIDNQKSEITIITIGK